MKNWIPGKFDNDDEYDYGDLITLQIIANQVSKFKPDQTPKNKSHIINSDSWTEGNPPGICKEYWKYEVTQCEKWVRRTTLETWRDSGDVKIYLVIWFDHQSNQRRKYYKYYKYVSEYSKENLELYIEKINNNEIKWMDHPDDGT